MMFHQSKIEDPHGPVRSLGCFLWNKHWHQDTGGIFRETRVMLAVGWLQVEDNDVVRHKGFKEAGGKVKMKLTINHGGRQAIVRRMDTLVDNYDYL